MTRRVLLIIADDWSPIAECYGHGGAPTPQIDRFAERATVFDRAFCTTPSCAASRASLLTGVHSHQHGQYGHCHGIHGFSTRQGIVTLPQICREAQVRCTLIGKNHTAPVESYSWDERSGPVLPTPDGWRQSIAGALDHDGPGFVMAAPNYPHRGGPDGWHTDRLEEAFGDAAIDPAAVEVPGFLPDLPGVRADLAGYLRAVGRFDACVGGMLSALAQHPDADDTLVMVLSDHGMPFPGAKASMYDAGHRCPLLIAVGGQPTGRCAIPVTWLDLFPTVCDWLGLPAPEDGESRVGRSLLPWLGTAGGASPEPRTVFASHGFHEVTMYDPYRFAHDGRWKFVQQLNHHAPLPFASDLFDSPTWQSILHEDVQRLGHRQRSDYIHRSPELLFDTEADPYETRNLIDEQPDQAERLRDALMGHRIATGDPWLMLDYQRGDPRAQPKSVVRR